MEEEKALASATIFAAVEDPRVERTKRHKLIDILIIALCGVICGPLEWSRFHTGAQRPTERYFASYVSFAHLGPYWRDHSRVGAHRSLGEDRPPFAFWFTTECRYVFS